jgi:hypothetical protein
MRNPRTLAAVFVSCLLFLLPCRHAAAAAAGGSAKGTTYVFHVSGMLFFDPALGVMIPMADDDYTDHVGVSFKLAFLTGGFIFRIGPIFLGPELAVDFTPLNVKEDYDQFNLKLFRMRIQAGARIVYPIPRYERMRLFWRFNIGMDIAWGDWDIRGVNEDDASTGLALDFIGGFEIMVHRIVGVGAYMALPVSVHTGHFFNVEGYNSLDLDFMAHVSIYPFEIK